MDDQIPEEPKEEEDAKAAQEETLESYDDPDAEAEAEATDAPSDEELEAYDDPDDGYESDPYMGDLGNLSPTPTPDHRPPSDNQHEREVDGPWKR